CRPGHGRRVEEPRRVCLGGEFRRGRLPGGGLDHPTAEGRDRARSGTFTVRDEGARRKPGNLMTVLANPRRRMKTNLCCLAISLLLLSHISSQSAHCPNPVDSLIQRVADLSYPGVREKPLLVSLAAASASFDA